MIRRWSGYQLATGFDLSWSSSSKVSWGGTVIEQNMHDRFLKSLKQELFLASCLYEGGRTITGLASQWNLMSQHIFVNSCLGWGIIIVHGTKHWPNKISGCILNLLTNGTNWMLRSGNVQIVLLKTVVDNLSCGHIVKRRSCWWHPCHVVISSEWKISYSE